MPKVRISTELDSPDVVLALLCDALRCKAADIEKELTRFAPAAIGEFIDMARLVH